MVGVIAPYHLNSAKNCPAERRGFLFVLLQSTFSLPSDLSWSPLSSPSEKPQSPNKSAFRANQVPYPRFPLKTEEQMTRIRGES